MLLDAKEKCCGCGACANACPKSCIVMTADEEGFLYPQVDEEVCVRCGLCERACPVLQAAPEEGDAPKAFAAYNKDEQIRAASSSGGVFTLLAEQVLAGGGVVFGAAMSEDLGSVRHVMVDTVEGLAALRGSKYVQSATGDCFAQAKQALEAGREVLFTGTPCQVEGLKAFLKKDYPGLLCADLICHGTPSPKVWDAYVRYREEQAGAKVKKISFRDKRRGWKMYSVCFQFENGKTYCRPGAEDLFIQVFLKDLCLRPSCYECSFKKLRRVSDLTLADLWGSRHTCPELDDDRGLSLILTHSPKGEAALEGLKDRIVIREVDRSKAVSCNPSMVTAAGKPEKRDVFMGKKNVVEDPERWSAYFPKPSMKQRAKDLAVRQYLWVKRLRRR